MLLSVTKRNGIKQEVSYDKLFKRINRLCGNLNRDFVNPEVVSKKVVEGLYDGVNTIELDNLAAETCAGLATTHPDYIKLAARISVSRLHKETSDSFSDTIEKLYNYIDPNTKKKAGLINDTTYKTVMKHKKKLNAVIDYSFDFNYDFFGIKTLERGYLLKTGGKITERPQHMLMRVAVGIWGDKIDEVIKTYNLLKEGYFTHATPTLFNAGTRKPNLSSCFLVAMKDDSMAGIYGTLGNIAQISKNAGGTSLHIHKIRARGSYIRGTNGISNGIVPMLRVYNETARYVDQGGGKRKGTIAVYLEPWHAEVFDFLDLKKNTGKEEQRARDLFYALWIPDLFMRRVREDKDWSLFCPDQCPGLYEVHSEEFDKLYEQYERDGKAKKVVRAQELWAKIIESQIETGTPYMLYKDPANQKSNQKNLGTIKSSNLCTEIIEYTDSDETAVCNLASIALKKFVNEDKTFDHKKLYDVAYQVAKNLNMVIDVTYYPIPEARKSNLRHRPMGIGVQALADTFALMRIPFESEEAKKLNKELFETIYFAALTSSKDQAKKEGSYESFNGSPASKGILQYDMWGKEPSSRWDWTKLKEEINKYGLRNSLLVAPMPTASTAQILGNNECFEPFTSNIYTRRTVSGEFIVINKYLVDDLVQLGLWNENMKNKILLGNGSIQHVQEIPQEIKDLYKTVWEISQKGVIDMAADRGAFIDQSQSMNIFMEDPNFAKISNMHFYGWNKGLKTGMYYLRTKAAVQAIQFTVDEFQRQKKNNKLTNEEIQEQLTCSIDNPDDCESCGS